MHCGYSEVTLLQLVSKEINLASRVAVDDGLRYGKRLIQITECVKFPFLLLDSHVKLPDTLKSQLIFFHQDSDRISHELGSQIQDFWSHCCRKQTDLDVWWQCLEDVINLVFETTGEHLICLVQHETYQVVHFQVTLPYHVEHTARCAHNKVLSLSEFINVITDRCATNACMAFDIVVIAQCERHFLDLVSKFARRCQDQALTSPYTKINALQTTNDKCSSLAGARLCLADGVSPIEDGFDATLLDGTRLLKTIRVDSTQKIFVQVIVVEGLKNWILLSSGNRHTFRRHQRLISKKSRVRCLWPWPNLS
mmetsp:Transcript_115699/g.230647  ORF Transcript_115699/g.230647 Transcript_115699/m.230647 type:complete len:309 (+) Transcript_115699:480-1406(+)